jgi:hypothetical protein
MLSMREDLLHPKWTTELAPCAATRRPCRSNRSCR